MRSKMLMSLGVAVLGFIVVMVFVMPDGYHPGESGIEPSDEYLLPEYPEYEPQKYEFVLECELETVGENETWQHEPVFDPFAQGCWCGVEGCEPCMFERLNELTRGDRVTLFDDDGEPITIPPINFFMPPSSVSGWEQFTISLSEEPTPECIEFILSYTGIPPELASIGKGEFINEVGVWSSIEELRDERFPGAEICPYTRWFLPYPYSPFMSDDEWLRNLQPMAVHSVCGEITSFWHQAGNEMLHLDTDVMSSDELYELWQKYRDVWIEEGEDPWWVIYQHIWLEGRPPRSIHLYGQPQKYDEPITPPADAMGVSEQSDEISPLNDRVYIGRLLWMQFPDGNMREMTIGHPMNDRFNSFATAPHTDTVDGSWTFCPFRGFYLGTVNRSHFDPHRDVAIVQMHGNLQTTVLSQPIFGFRFPALPDRPDFWI